MSAVFRTVQAARSIAAASSARPLALSTPAALRFAPRASTSAFASVRFNSSLPPDMFSAASSSSSTRPADAEATAEAAAFEPTQTTRAPRFGGGGGRLTDVIPSAIKDDHPDAWWRVDSAMSHNEGRPGNQFTGRSTPVFRGGFSAGYRIMSSNINQSRIKPELRHLQYHERPSARNWRVRGQRFRRRFQEEVSGAIGMVEGGGAGMVVWVC